LVWAKAMQFSFSSSWMTSELTDEGLRLSANPHV
jgi:hypothetical protein